MDTIRLMKPTLLDPTIYEDVGTKYDYKNELTQESRVFDGIASAWLDFWAMAATLPVHQFERIPL